MYIIPYFLENEAKKLLKLKLNHVIDNTSINTTKNEELTFSIFENNSSNVPLLYNNDSLTRIALRNLAE